MGNLILFAKRPRRGAVKTRLIRQLGIDGTLTLYRAFLQDSLGILRGMPGDHSVEVWLAGPGDLDEPLRVGLPTREQPEGDLGRRLCFAFEESHRRGSSATVVIGADSPTLPRSLILAAFEALDGGADATLAPSEDGGYVLIGLREPQPLLFRGIPWGGPDVATRTAESARRAGLALATLATWYDVDDAQGLERLRAELADPRVALRAPATHRALSGPGSRDA